MQLSFNQILNGAVGGAAGGLVVVFCVWLANKIRKAWNYNFKGPYLNIDSRVFEEPYPKHSGQTSILHKWKIRLSIRNQTPQNVFKLSWDWIEKPAGLKEELSADDHLESTKNTLIVAAFRLTKSRSEWEKLFNKDKQYMPPEISSYGLLFTYESKLGKRLYTLHQYINGISKTSRHYFKPDKEIRKLGEVITNDRLGMT